MAKKHFFTGHAHNNDEHAEKTIFDQISLCRRTSSLDHSTFIPASCIDKLTTGDNIRAELNSPRNEIVDYARIKAFKLFVILAGLQKQSYLPRFYAAGFTDHDLVHDESELMSIVQHRASELRRIWKPLTEALISGRGAIHQFCQHQWEVLAPVIKEYPQRYTLLSKTPLPVIWHEQRAAGGFSTVYIARIQPCHRSQSSSGILERCIKRLSKSPHANTKTVIEMYKREATMLDNFARDSHRHLIRYEAAIERGEEWFFIFPWADGGNLSNFWERHTYPDGDSATLLWLLEQLEGLADALLFLHDRNIRHGDLKPENILMFLDGDSFGRLIIADVGLASQHNRNTEYRLGIPTQTMSGTRKYEPPEVGNHEDQPEDETEMDSQQAARSRLYDTWSMGCIILEAIIWFLWGTQSLQNFMRKLPSRSPLWESHDPFALYTEVVDTIVWLRKDRRCRADTPIGDLLDFVEKYLLVVQDQRARAADLRDKVRDVRNRSRWDQDYQARSACASPAGMSFMSNSTPRAVTSNGLLSPGSFHHGR